MRLMAIYPRGKGRVEVAVEHEGIGYVFAREMKLDWSAVDACYPLRDKAANDACLAARAALVEKHRTEIEKWAEPLVTAQIAAAASAKVAADAVATKAAADAKVLAYVAANPQDATVKALLSKATIAKAVI